MFNFTKMGKFILNHLNFSKFSVRAAPKICHFSPFSQFFGAFGAEKVVPLSQKWPPFWQLAPPIGAQIIIHNCIFITD